MTPAFASFFLVGVVRLNQSNQSCIICRANREVGGKAMTLSAMRVGRARPAACEISQIVKSQRQKAKFGLWPLDVALISIEQQAKRRIIAMQQLPGLFRRMRELEKQVEELKVRCRG